MFTADQIAKLEAPLHPSRVKQREGAGKMKLDHLEGWDVIRHANEVFGFDGWSFETVEMREVWAGEKGQPGKQKPAVAYIAKVRLAIFAGERIIVREGTGFGNGEGWNPGDAHELASKEAETDAMKRAFMKFGMGFGLALYDKSKEYVSDEGAPPPPPPPKAEPKREPEPKPEPKKEPVRAAARTNADAQHKTRDIPAPKIAANANDDQVKQAWAGWWRELTTSLRVCTDRRGAQAQCAAVSAQLDQMGVATGNDGRALLAEIIDRRFPKLDGAKIDRSEDAPPEPATESGAAHVFTVDPPKVQSPKSWGVWCNSVADLIEKRAETRREALTVIEVNKRHFEPASGFLKKSIETAMMVRLNNAFPEANGAKTR